MNKIVTLLSAAALVVGGCSVTSATNGLGGKCTSNSDCLASLECSGNVCVDTGASSTGGATSGATDGGSSAGATSSAGSSSGTSAGSSSGGSPTTASLRVVNASQPTAARAAGAIDVCVKASTDSDFASAGIVGGNGVAYGAASNFISVTDDTSVTLRAVASGGDCSSALSGVADLTAQDFSTTANHFTVVVTATGLVLATNLPPASGDVTNVAVVNALTGTTGDTAILAPLPYTSFGSLAANTSVDADVSSFSGAALQVGTALYAKSVTTSAIATGSRATVVTLGDVTQVSGATAPQVLVCDDATQANCKLTALGTQALAYVRLANLVDSSDALGSVNLCLKTALVGPFSGAPVISSVASNVVSGFIVVNAGTEYVSVVQGPANDCTGANQLTDTSASFAANASDYVTLSLTGSVAFGEYDIVGKTHTPTTTNAALFEIAIFNGATDADASLGASLFNLATTLDTLNNAGVSLDYQGQQAVQRTTTTVADLLGQSVRAIGGQDDLDFLVPTLVTSSTSFSLLLGGDAQSHATALVCADDGSVDSNGDSLCGTSAATIPVTTHEASVRVANLSAAAGTLDLCAGTATIISNVATGTVSAFVARPSGTLKYGYVAHGGDCGSPLAQTAANVSIGLGDYLTVLVEGQAAVTLSKQTTPITVALDATHAVVNFANAWQSATGVDHTGVIISVPGDTSTGLDVGHFSGFHAFSTATAVTTASVSDSTLLSPATFTLPPAPLDIESTGAYDAFVIGDASGNPQIVWCADQLIDQNGNTACTVLDAN